MFGRLQPKESAMLRRDALATLAVSGAGILLGGCSPAAAPVDAASPIDIGSLLHQLTDYTLRPNEGSAVLASLQGNRFTAAVDPTIQPTDFDAETDA
jgi:hypothetical protein